MTQGQVEALVGPPETMTMNGLGEPDASYESFSIRYSKQNRTMVEIGFAPTVRVTVRGMDPFTQKKRIS